MGAQQNGSCQLPAAEDISVPAKVLTICDEFTAKGMGRLTMRVQRSAVRPSLLKPFRGRLLEEIVRGRDDAFGERVTSLRSLIPLASPVDERV